VFIVIQKPNSNKVFLSYSYLILKKMKSSRRLAENDIITRGETVKIQQVAVRGNYENPSSDAKCEVE
jgi:hypothetical protein